MRDIETDELIDQEEPDLRANFLFDALNPAGYPERSADIPIRFVVGEIDTHVPQKLQRISAKVNASGGLVTVQTIAGLRHLDFVRREWWLSLEV